MRKFIILLICAVFAADVCAWNKLGHDASAMIAEKYLTKKAQKNMAKYLDGRGIAWYSSFMDYMGYIDKLGISNEWFDHCAPVDKDFNYAEGEFGRSGGTQKGDAVMCIRRAVEAMKDGGYKSLPDSMVNLYLKWLIHFVPDTHCPSHIIYNFRSTNYQVEIGSTKILFHSTWDAIPDTYGLHDWSASEFCSQLTFNLTKAQKKEIEMGGDILAWVHQSAKDCVVAYDIVRENEKVTEKDRFKATVLVDKQLVKGGVRLAYLLNMIFNK